MTKHVYECEISKKTDLMTIIEVDPYATDSFARVSHKVKEGQLIGQDAKKVYLYISASDEFLKKAAEKLKEIAVRCKKETEDDIISKVDAEDSNAETGFGSIFGE